MGKFLLTVGMVGGLHQDLWEILRGGVPVYSYFLIGVMGRNTFHPEGVGEPV